MKQGSAARHWSGPYLRREDAAFAVVGVEVHNSSSSTADQIARSFATASGLGANTVLAPVAWNLFEPEEGVFDPALIEIMISTARDLELKLIPLWFGTWKNAASSYAPDWVKKDGVRFPRAVASGRRVEHVSAFSMAAREADARAFAELMRCIRQLDADGVVVAVQVENEIGLLGDSRDRSPLAEAAFAELVPEAVIGAVAGDPSMPLHREWVEHGALRAGRWEEVFPPGDRRDEAFMASAFATFTEAVASAGTAEYDVPLFVNAWLDADSVLDGPVALAGGKRPGDYPSGGPVVAVAAIWEARAPSLDFLAVDLYVSDAEPPFEAFKSRRGRLFVPELRADDVGIAQMFSALGQHRATGIATFGSDSFDLSSPEATALTDANRLLRAAGSLLSANPDAVSYGFVLDETRPGVRLEFDGVVLDVHTRDEYGYVIPVYPAYGLAIETSDGIYVMGRGFWITYGATDDSEIGLLALDHFAPNGDGLTLVSRLNGDEGGSIIPFPFPNMGLVPGRAIPTRLAESGIMRISTYTY